MPGGARLKNRGRSGTLPSLVTQRLRGCTQNNEWFDQTVTFLRTTSQLSMVQKCSFWKNGPCCGAQLKLLLTFPKGTEAAQLTTTEPTLLELLSRGSHNSHRNQEDYEHNEPLPRKRVETTLSLFSLFVLTYILASLLGGFGRRR